MCMPILYTHTKVRKETEGAAASGVSSLLAKCQSTYVYISLLLIYTFYFYIFDILIQTDVIFVNLKKIRREKFFYKHYQF